MSESKRAEDFLLAKKPDEQSASFEAEAGASPRMLDIVFKNGDRVALPYHYLVRARIRGQTTIELEFTNCTATIVGRNLMGLFQHLIAHSARRIWESKTEFDDGKQTWVRSVEVKDTERRG
jgi:hypothetical protein